MSLTYTNKAYGNLRVFDVRSHINLQKVIPAFQRLKAEQHTDAHVLQNTTQLQCTRVGCVVNKTANITNIQSIVHDDRVLYSLLDMFITSAYTQPDTDAFDISIQFQRTLVWPDDQKMNLVRHPIHPMHPIQGGIIGVICVQRENVIGGAHQFNTIQTSTSTSDILTKEIPPGYMVIFNDNSVHHRVTKLECADQRIFEGYHDVIVMTMSSV